MRPELTKQLLWALALMGAWMLFVVTTQLPEVLLGLGSAVLAYIGVAAIRRQVGLFGLVKLRWLRDALVLVPRLVTDTFLVFRALGRQLFQGQHVTGAFMAMPYSPGQHDQLSALSADAFAVASNSLTPNTIVLDVDPVEGLILVHQLEPQTPAEAQRDLVRPA